MNHTFDYRLAYILYFYDTPYYQLFRFVVVLLLRDLRFEENRNNNKQDCDGKSDKMFENL